MALSFESKFAAPQNLAQLLNRAEALSGYTLEQLAAQLSEPQAISSQHLPSKPAAEKGFYGQLIERLLGAEAGSLAEPDFPQLGVELKTIPLDLNGIPLESTWVSVLPMKSDLSLTWQTSAVFKKLQRVLWVPIVGEKSQNYGSRIVGSPLYWQPNPEQMAILQSDWEEAMEKVARGQFGELNARFGEALQVRPKAAHSGVVTEVIDADGNAGKTLPRGFYLRSSFTRQLIQQLLY